MATIRASAPGEDPRGIRNSTSHEPPAALDPEVLEFVRRFEQGYAEVAPNEALPSVKGLKDEPFPGVQDLFDDTRDIRTAANEPARVVPMPRREPELSSAPPPAAALPPQPLSRADDAEVDLDEAMAILRASERSGGRERAGDAHAQKTSTRHVHTAPVERASTAQVEVPAPQPAAPVAYQAASDWTSKSRQTYTVVTLAALVALLVGGAGGYLMGQTSILPHAAALIKPSPEGGTHLKLDIKLPQQR